MHSNKIAKGLSLKDFKKKNTNVSYLLKEIKTLIRTPIFCLQCLVMPIIYPIVVFFLMALFINFANKIVVDALKGFSQT